MIDHPIRRNHLKLLCAAGAVSLLLAAFGTSARAATPKSLPPITIGVSLSFSGDFSADGLGFKQGYQLWADTVNKAGGVLGRKVRFIMLSDASSPV